MCNRCKIHFRAWKSELLFMAVGAPGLIRQHLCSTSRSLIRRSSKPWVGVSSSRRSSPLKCSIHDALQPASRALRPEQVPE